MNDSSSTPKLLLSVRETAEALGVCEKTVWSLTVPRGNLRPVKIGARVLYYVADLTAWIESKKQEGGTP